MRYVLESSNKKEVELTQEIDFLQNFKVLLKKEIEKKKSKLSGYILSAFKDRHLNQCVMKLESRRKMLEKKKENTIED